MNYKDLKPRASRRQVLEWFEELEDDQQEAIMNSPKNRTPHEDANTYLKRVRVRRIVHQTIDRYERRVANL